MRKKITRRKVIVPEQAVTQFRELRIQYGQKAERVTRLSKMLEKMGKGGGLELKRQLEAELREAEQEEYTLSNFLREFEKKHPGVAIVLAQRLAAQNK